MGKANLSGGAGGSAWQISPGAKPLRAGLGGSAENCRSIKKFTWCMKRSSGKAGIMG